MLLASSIIASAQCTKPVIFDTDWWTDVDDACAVRLLLDAERKGDVDVLGICISAVNETSVKSLDSFLRHEGRSEMPLGIDSEATDFTGEPCYHQLIIDSCDDRSARDNADCADCVAFYRQLLASSKGKVDIVAVGYPNTLARLLESGADNVSRLDGRRLVKRKVSHLWIMAGNYPEGEENNFTRTARSRSAGALLCSEWPTEITFLGHEVGIRVVAGGRLKEEDLLHKVLARHGSAKGRYAWDPMTVMLAISGDAEKEGYRLVRGWNTVDPETGANIFREDPDGRHSYVVMTEPAEWYAGRLDDLLLSAAGYQVSNRVIWNPAGSLLSVRASTESIMQK